MGLFFGSSVKLKINLIRYKICGKVIFVYKIIIYLIRMTFKNSLSIKLFYLYSIKIYFVLIIYKSKKLHSKY